MAKLEVMNSRLNSFLSDMKC